MVKCIFCGKEESPHRGLHLIKNDGSISYYCSSKCRHNSIKLGRDSRKVRWTEAYRITRTKVKASIQKQKKIADDKANAVKEIAKETRQEIKSEVKPVKKISVQNIK